MTDINESQPSLRILILGAHPDDAEFHAGGLATLYRRAGHAVKMVSVTCGDAGHHLTYGPQLAARRKLEAQAAGAVIGAQYEVWPYPDGRLEPSLAVRAHIIRELRTFKPDLVLTHRTNDYHPDHRAVGHAVRDASYMVTVPAMVPDVPALRCDPVVAFMPDRFEKPTPLEGHVVIDVDDCLDTIVEMLACHESQVFEWLPYNRVEDAPVPEGRAERLAWLKAWYIERIWMQADRYREELIETYGKKRGRKIEFCEAYEISEYARQLDDEEAARLFPFLSQSHDNA